MEKKPVTLDDVWSDDYLPENPPPSTEWPTRVSYGVVRPATLDELLFND